MDVTVMIVASRARVNPFRPSLIENQIPDSLQENGKQRLGAVHLAH